MLGTSISANYGPPFRINVVGLYGAAFAPAQSRHCRVCDIRLVMRANRIPAGGARGISGVNGASTKGISPVDPRVDSVIRPTLQYCGEIY